MYLFGQTPHTQDIPPPLPPVWSCSPPSDDLIRSVHSIWSLHSNWSLYSIWSVDSNWSVHSICALYPVCALELIFDNGFSYSRSPPHPSVNSIRSLFDDWFSCSSSSSSHPCLDSLYSSTIDFLSASFLKATQLNWIVSLSWILGWHLLNCRFGIFCLEQKH